MNFSLRVIAVVLAFLSAGCAADHKVWGFDREQFVSRLYHGDYDFLRGIDYSHLNTREIMELGDGAPYYMGLVYRRLGMEEQAQSMLKLSVDRSDEPWRRAAGLALVEDYFDNQQYKKAADLAGELKRTYTDTQDFRVLEARALYWLDRDQETLSSVSSLTRDGGPRALRSPQVRRLVADGNLALWRAAAADRLGSPDWKQAMLDVFERYPASDIHARLYIFLQYRNQLTSAFSPAEQLLISGKYEQSQRKYHDALAAYEKLMDMLDGTAPEIASLLSPDTIDDAGRTYSLLGQFTRGAQRLEKLALMLVGDPRSAALDNAGRLYYRAGRYADAVRVLRAAYALVTAGNSDWYEPRKRDRIIWYLLDSQFRRDPSAAAETLTRYLPAISDRHYFDDTVEDLLSTLVNRHDWKEVDAVHSVLTEAGYVGEAAGYGVVLAEAADKGLYRLPPDSADLASASGSRASSGRSAMITLLRQAAAQTDDLYYRFVAAAALDRLGAGEPDTSVMEIVDGPAADAASGSAGDADRLVSGYFEYGLLDEGYAEIRELWQQTSQQTLERAAADLAGRNRVTESLRTMDLARTKSDFALSRLQAKLLYPLAFPVEMDLAISNERLDRSLFYAVVREESYFESTVSSHAGAIGLSQLMPDTAADVARRMGLKSPDLADPGTNLNIGAWYLRDLLDRFHEPVLALAAYNGGLGRVRQWQRSHDLPSLLLFHESIPLSETRSYIRKVLVSNAYYGYLYQGRTLSQVVGSFFPDLISGSSTAGR